MHEVIETIRNEGVADLTVVIEPWGMPLSLRSGHTFSLIGKARSAGQFEIVKETEGVVIYAWPGSTVDVFDGDVLVERFSTPVPSVPPDRSVKEFLDLMLGEPVRTG